MKGSLKQVIYFPVIPFDSSGLIHRHQNVNGLAVRGFGLAVAVSESMVASTCSEQRDFTWALVESHPKVQRVLRTRIVKAR